MVILLAMDDERKPKEDLKEGLGLIFRAAKGAVKQVDIGKIDKELDKAISQVGRVVSNVGRVVGDEIGRMANNPPWQKGRHAVQRQGQRRQLRRTAACLSTPAVC
jgi:hypothetical protein